MFIASYRNRKEKAKATAKIILLGHSCKNTSVVMLLEMPECTDGNHQALRKEPIVIVLVLRKSSPILTI